MKTDEVRELVQESGSIRAGQSFTDPCTCLQRTFNIFVEDLSATTNTCANRSYYSKRQFTSYPRCNDRISFFSFFCDHFGKTSIELLTLSTHASRSRHDHWRKGSMLDLQNSLVIRFLLLFFIDFLCLAKLLANISLCVWVKNPYTKKCNLTCCPEASSTDV